MNIKFNAAWKPLAALGLALALAGCNGNNGGAGGSGGLLGGGGSSETLATVGGTAITRTDLGKIMEAQYGKEILPILIDNQLLENAAKEAGVSVTDAELTTELADLRKKSPELEKQLTDNPLLVDFYKNLLVKRNLLVQRILTKDVKAPTDAELQKFYETNKTYYGEPAQIKIGALLSATKPRADAMSRAIKAKTKTFAQLVAEQQKSQDQVAASSREGDSFLPVSALPVVMEPEVAKKVEALPKGGTTDPVQQTPPPSPMDPTPGQSFYILYHVTDKKAAVTPPFAEIKTQLLTDYKMAQIAREENKKNPENPAFEETLRRTSAAMRDPQNPAAPAPSLRDIFTVIMGPLREKTLNDLKVKGTVKIDDANYSALAESYKPIPTAVPAPPAGAATAGGTAGAPATNPGAPATGAPAAGAVPPAAEAPATEAPAAPAANSATP